MLFAEFPDAAEGELSRRFAELVRRESCAEVAIAWGVGPFIRLGGAEAQTGGRKKGAILADVCEALIGAAFLDGGYPAAERVVAGAWRGRMLAPRRPLLDAKTALQEWTQARGLPPPVYAETRRGGPAHNPEFTIAVTVGDLAPGEGRGSSKRVAQQGAAEAVMRREGIWGDAAGDAS